MNYRSKKLKLLAYCLLFYLTKSTTLLQPEVTNYLIQTTECALYKSYVSWSTFAKVFFEVNFHLADPTQSPRFLLQISYNTTPSYTKVNGTPNSITSTQEFLGLEGLYIPKIKFTVEMHASERPNDEIVVQICDFGNFLHGYTQYNPLHIQVRPSYISLDQLSSNLVCPDNCNTDTLQGSCANAFCTCELGFLGADCNTQANYLSNNSTATYAVPANGQIIFQTPSNTNFDTFTILFKAIENANQTLSDPTDLNMYYLLGTTYLKSFPCPLYYDNNYTNMLTLQYQTLSINSSGIVAPESTSSNFVPNAAFAIYSSSSV